MSAVAPPHFTCAPLGLISRIKDPQLCSVKAAGLHKPTPVSVMPARSTPARSSDHTSPANQRAAGDKNTPLTQWYQDGITAAAQRTEKQKQLKEMQKTFQQRIQQREKDLQQLREAVESHKRSAQTAVEDSERIFTELIRSIERSRSELIRLIRDQEKAAVSRAEGRLERLEQEINDLRRRDAELEQLSHTQDHIQFLQNFQSLSAPPESTNRNDNLFSSLISFDGLRKSVHQLRDKLEDFCKEELKKIPDRATFTNIVPRTRNNFLRYSHQLTLDLNTKQLKEMQKTFQQRIQQREKDLQQLRETVESHKRSAQTAVEDSERIFTELIRSIKRSRSELIQLIRDQEKAAVSRAEGRLERLEQEINDLRRRDAELEQLSHTQDHIQFLQSFQSLSAPPEFTDLNEYPFTTLFSPDGLRKSVCQLRDKLEDFCKEQLKISDRVTFTNIVSKTRNDFLQYSHQLTLDLNTVNQWLRLSENNRKQLKETQKTFQQRIQQREKDLQQLRETVESHKKQLKETQKTFQQRIQQREKDLQQLRETVESHKRSAQTAVEDSERIFTELIRSIERSRSELIRLIRDQETAAVSRAEGRLERLEQEINDLRRRDAELEQLSHTQDHIQFLQSFQSLSAPPKSTDANDNPFISFFSSDGLRESVHQLRDKLEDFCNEELKKISDRVTFTNIVLWTKNDFLQFAAQRTEKQMQLKETQKTFQQRIQQREKDLQQLRETVESHKRSAQTAVEDSERIFTELIRSIERSRSELIRLIRDQEKAAVSRAEGRLERLEQEINDLRRRDAELEQLSHTQDHIQFLQSLGFQSLSASSESTDGNDDPFSSLLSSDGLRESVHQLKDKLENFCKEEFKKISDRATFTNIVLWTRNHFLQYSHQLTLDLNTAHKRLTAEQRTEKQKQLKEMQKMFQQRIQQREKDLQQLRAVLLSHKISAQTAVEELIRLIRDQEKFAVFQVEGRLMQLEQEINDLRRRDAELEQLSHKQDLFLQSFQSLSAPPEFTDVNDDLFSSFLTFHGLGECVNQLKDKVKDFCKEDLKKISDRVTFTNIAPRTRNEFLQYSQQLTFDPNTAQKNIHLSENNRVVTGTHIEQSLREEMMTELTENVFDGRIAQCSIQLHCG
ncbi:hypothetical protein Q8A67_008420 [Cirrhinus molitorella]|uniref:TRIM8/14/16/25/29/45/65 coiled-coil region domain-containing protein n=1 Tax=Cirrhinus molitorella TaxID=172907 RepID=A0AA88PX97_9TELE|nr:hypothetical protein Q8A67_008420 [Cirrhinus molitorella]